MPSVPINFFYSLMAMMIVSMLLTCSFASYVNLLRGTSEINSLREVVDRVAAKAEGALATIIAHNATMSILIQLPTRIGYRDYWIRLANDSSKAWLEGGFGKAPISGEKTYRVYFPRKAYASGTFEGGYNLALLSCFLNGSVPQLVLSR